MPPKPRAAALRKASTGKVSFSSQSRACGIISAAAKSRAVAWKACCSSLSVKSMSSLCQPSGVTSPEHPRGRVGDRPALIEREDALDAADQRPDEPPQQDQKSDQHEAEHHADDEVQKPDPERPDLEPVVRAQQRVR